MEIGPYRAVEKIGEGACAEVFRAAAAGGHIAIKIIKDPADRDAALSLREEFRSLASLTHPNIVSVRDFGISGDGRVFFTMDYVDGVHFHRAFRGFSKPLLAALVQVLGALNYIHNMGYVHGDLKPENMIVTRAARAASVKLTDFGMTLNRGVTASLGPGGTPLYMAPEVFSGRKPDGRADLYSLGVVIFETLAGRERLTISMPSLLLKDRLTVDLPSVSTLTGDVPAPFRRLLERLIRREPENRPRDAPEVLEALSQFFPRGPFPAVSDRMRPLLSSGLVGRKRELEKLMRRVRTADRSRNTLTFITGPHGIGKSRMLRELKTLAQLEGVQVLPVSCDGSGTDPIGPLVQLAPEDRGQALGEQALMDFEHPGHENLVLGYENVSNALARMASVSHKKLLLIIDDIELAPPHARALVRYLLRHSKPERGLALAAASTGGALLDGETAGLDVETLNLSPLGRDSSGRVISNMLGFDATRDLVDWVHKYSGGVPLLVEETLAWLSREGIVDRTGNRLAVTWSELDRKKAPRTVAAVTGLLVRGLAKDQFDLLEAASVIGDVFDQDLLAAAAGRSGVEVSRLLRGLQSRNLILRESGAKYSFAHKWLSRKLYSDIEKKRKVDLHRRILREIESRNPDEAGQLAKHALAAGLRTKTVEHSVAAARQAAAAYAYGPAAELYRTALSRIGSGGQRRRSIIEEMADVQVRTGEYRDALSGYTALTGSPRRMVKPEERARVLRKAALCRYYLEETDSAESLLEDARRLTLGWQNPERARILLLSGWNRMKTGSSTEAGEYCRAALKSARELGECDIESRSLAALATMEERQGNLAAARELALESVRAAREPAAGHSMQNSLYLLGSMEMESGLLTDAQEHLEEAVRLARKENRIWSLGSALVNLALVEQRFGKLETAVLRLKEALDLFAKLGDMDHAARTENNLGFLYDLSGSWDKALDHYGRGLAICEKLGLKESAAVCHQNIGLLLAHRGETESCIDHLNRGVELADSSGRPGARLEACNAMSEGLLAQGRFEQAIAWAERGEKTARENGLSPAESLLQRSEAYLGLHDRDAAVKALNDAMPLPQADSWLEARFLRLKAQLLEEGAAESISRSITLFKAEGDRFETARSLAVEASLCGMDRIRPEGSRPVDRAVESCEAALEIFKALGAEPMISQASRQMAAYKKSARDVRGEENVYLKTIFAVNKMLDLLTEGEDALDRILDKVIDILGAERGMVLLLNDQGQLIPAAGRNIDRRSEKDVTQISRTVVRDVASSRRAITSGSAAEDPRYMNMPSIALHGIRSLMCIPLSNRGETLGALYVDHKRVRNLFTPYDDEFLLTVGNLIAAVIDRRRYIDGLESRNVELKRLLGKGFASENLIGDSREMIEVFKMIERAASTDRSVLITGERGTGRGLVARAVHFESARSGLPFITLDASLIPAGLVEDTLFGHVRGAFSGAYGDAPGLLEAADTGTLFIDNAESMPLDVQSKLSVALKSREIRRLGSPRTKKLDYRTVAAASVNLGEHVEKGMFRLDLLLLLNVLEIRLPPLRERGTDLYRLASHFLSEFSAKAGKHMSGFSGEALEAISSHPWPGNVSELKRAIERAVVLSAGETVLPKDLGFKPSVSGAASATLKYSKTAAEVSELTHAMLECRGNVSRAARVLGVSRRQVQRLLKKHSLRASEFKSMSEGPMQEGGS